VRSIVGGLHARPARAVVDGLRAAAEEHSGGVLADDLCVLAVRNRAPKRAAAPTA
jgi:hypothetical protein